MDDRQFLSDQGIPVVFTSGVSIANPTGFSISFCMVLYMLDKSIFLPFGFWVCKDCQNLVFYKSRYERLEFFLRR